MDEFLKIVNDILNNKVEDIYEEGRFGQTIHFSTLNTILDSIGVRMETPNEQHFSELVVKKRKRARYISAAISWASGIAFYVLWLKLFLGLQNHMMNLFLSLLFADVVFLICGYVFYRNPNQNLASYLGALHFEVNQDIIASEQKILKRLHIPMKDAKLASYQTICNVLKKNCIIFPEGLKDARDEINYLKIRQQEGVFEIKQDEICILLPKEKR